MFVGGGVLIRVVVQGIRRQAVGVRAEVVGGARSAAREGDAVEASWDGQGGAEDPGHQLVSRVGVHGRAAGVPLVLPPAVLCAGRDMRTVRTRQYVLARVYFQCVCV